MDIRVTVGEFRAEPHIRAAVERVIQSGRISEGRETRAFEADLSKYIGARNAVAVNSGTSALIAGLLAIKSRLRASKGQQPRVIASPLTYVATANAITLAGMEPVFVDVNPDTYSILPNEVSELVEGRRGPRYSVLLPVHLMGYVCDMNRLNSVAATHDLTVVEDSSQAHGSLYKGKRAGSMSDLSTFSFYIAHNIQAGELGAVLTNDSDLARHIRKIKANGRLCDCLICTRPQGKCPKFGKGKEAWDPRFLHDEIGYNFKTMEFPTAIASAQLKHADDIAKARRKNVRILNNLLSKHDDILALPRYSEDVSYLGYPLVIKSPKKLNREKLQQSLESNGVETRPLFGCIPLHQPAYAHLKRQYKDKLPNAEYLGANAFYIGCHQYLSDEDLQFAARAFDKSIKQVLR